MRHKGNIDTFRLQRDNALLAAYRKQISEARHITLSDILEKVVNMPTERFWVNEERATIVIGQMIAGDDLAGMRPNKRKMYEEIYCRVREIMSSHEGMRLYDAVWQVVNGPAPMFYLTPKSAKTILNRSRKEKRRLAQGQPNGVS